MIYQPFNKIQIFITELSSVSLNTMALCTRIHRKRLFSNAIFQQSRLSEVIFKVLHKSPLIHPISRNGYVPKCDLGGGLGGGPVRYLCTPVAGRELRGVGNAVRDKGWGDLMPKRKQPKGKREVRRFLKLMRYRQKKAFEMMTPEEKIVYRLQKARKKEARLMAAIAKLEPKAKSVTHHDPEILTPEEHFYFLKKGQKSKNYVPVGRRGLYQGVILNMHLHWKKHETLQVIVKSHPREEVKEIAVDLARLSGGMVLDIQEKNTIIMYRGKNYSQPPSGIMSPICTLPRFKALKKSKYMEALRSIRQHIPKLQQSLEFLNARSGTVSSVPEDKPTNADNDLGCASDIQSKSYKRLKELITKTEELIDKTEVDNEIKDTESVSLTVSDTEDLSDIFETESDRENDDDEGEHLYLDEFEMFPVYNNKEAENFEDHLRQISADARKEKSQGRSDGLPELDEVDRMVLRVASSLKKKGI